jgi:hypothetical protein
MYRTALLAYSMGKNAKPNSKEFNELDKIVTDFNLGEQFSTFGNDEDSYSILKQ